MHVHIYAHTISCTYIILYYLIQLIHCTRYHIYIKEKLRIEEGQQTIQRRSCIVLLFVYIAEVNKACY